jgi:hypothetical protein
MISSADFVDYFGEDCSDSVVSAGAQRFFVKIVPTALATQRCRAVHSLAVNVNVPEAIGIDAANKLGVLDRFDNDLKNELIRADRIFVTRLCQSYSLSDLKIRNLTEAIAAELAFSVWVSRRDAHNCNRVYVSGIPMFFDFDLALDGYQAPFFKDGATSGYAPNWRLHLCDDPWTEIVTAEFRKLERGKPITLHPISSEEEFWRHFEAHIERIRHLDDSFIRERISAVIGDESLRDHYTDFVVRQKSRLADDAEQVKAVLRQPLSDLHKEIYEESRRKAKEAAISEAERVRQALAQAEATRHALESKIELLLASKSWRITAPLRAASRFLRRRRVP